MFDGDRIGTRGLPHDSLLDQCRILESILGHHWRNHRKHVHFRIRKFHHGLNHHHFRDHHHHQGGMEEEEGEKRKRPRLLRAGSSPSLASWGRPVACRRGVSDR